ncbi:MAG: single-stranded-DNA-specific exonuclease RecJ [Pseudomonadota bacterium]
MSGTAFLGVERSALAHRWTGPGAEVERMGLAIAQRAGLPEIVGRILALRGVAPEAAQGYLDPTLKSLMPDPSVVTDLDRAAERLAEAVMHQQRIAVFGDYDVDGAASTALLLDWLRALGLAATPYIPDRIDEGYGPNVPAMTELGKTHDLILCVDCGTLSHEPLAAARQAGADVLVIDHHLPGETLPPALAVVNPNRPDDASTLAHLCAAGVVFLLLVAANRCLRGKGVFAERHEPDLRHALDLVAVATVADVAPLIGLNRAFVRQGLKVLAGRGRPGLAALADTSGLSAPPSSRDLGFAIGPRINAGGRIGQADLGLRLLTAQSAAEAEALAARLDALNRERRALEAQVLDAALAQVETRDQAAPLIWAAGEGWHPGVVGIVASRLKERFNRPAVVIGMMNGEAKGSGRSVSGIDLGAAVAEAARTGLLLKGGGHKMAAGLSVAPDRISAAMEAISVHLAAQGAGQAGPQDLAIDGAVMPAAATPDLVETIEAAGPFGPANPAPRLALPRVRLAHLKPVGQGHAQLRLAGPSGPTLEAIAFRAAETGLLALFEQARQSDSPLHLVGQLEIDDWGGRRRAKLRVEDAATP